MPRTRTHNVTAAQWSPNGGALGQGDLSQPGSYPFGENVFSEDVQRARLPKAVFKQLQATLEEGGPLDARPRRRRRRRHARLGAGEGRDPLHALVPAADRLDRREARLVLRAHRRRHRDRRVLRQGADPGRARRLLVPDRRHPADLRGARLHRLGPDLAGVHHRQPERRGAGDPDRVHVVDGRGARPQDPAAALDGRAVEVGRARAASCSATRRPSASSRPSGPSRSTS